MSQLPLWKIVLLLSEDSTVAEMVQGNISSQFYSFIVPIATPLSLTMGVEVPILRTGILKGHVGSNRDLI